MEAPFLWKSKSKALERCLCCPVLQRVQEDQPGSEFAFLLLLESWGLGPGLDGTRPREDAVLALSFCQDGGLSGISSILGISNAGFTAGTQLLGFRVQVRLPGVPPVLITLFLDVFVFV